MNLLTKIQQYGLEESLPEWKADKIRLCTLLSLLVVGMNIPFIFFFLTYYPAITFIPVLSIASIGLYFVLLRLGLYDAARIITSTVSSSTTIAAIHLALLKPGDELILPLFVMQMIICLCPLLNFGYKERQNLLMVLAINILTLFLVINLEGFNQWNYDTSLFRSGIMFQIGIYSAAFLFILFIYLIYQNYANLAYKQEQTIEDMHHKQQELEKNGQELNRYIQEVEISHEEDEKRQWIATGSSNIDRILRSNRDIEELQDALIQEIVKYTKSNQGGFFILNDEMDPFLELTSCYAYDRKKFIQKRIEIGQGLVGQCYLEAEITLLTEVPQNYISITSGLGEANPRCLILIPLVFNEAVQGVLELAAFHTYSKHEITYLQEAAASLASYIVNLKTNQRTSRLLTQFQEQTEMMQAQEEEMRQNLEELQATQEQMQRLKEEEKARFDLIEKENRHLRKLMEEKGINF
jgi:hypothetical protein